MTAGSGLKEVVLDWAPVAGALAIVAAVVFLLAPSFGIFVLAWTLQGVFRALDSGPLEAWYVDTAHAEDPTAPVERALTRAGHLARPRRVTPAARPAPCLAGRGSAPA